MNAWRRPAGREKAVWDRFRAASKSVGSLGALSKTALDWAVFVSRCGADVARPEMANREPHRCYNSRASSAHSRFREPDARPANLHVSRHRHVGRRADGWLRL